MNRIFAVFANFIHALIMLGYGVSPFFLSIYWVLAFFLIIYIHQIIFSGCLITIIQHRLNLLDKDRDFVDNFIVTVFKVKLKEEQYELIGESLLLAPLILAIFIS